MMARISVCSSRWCSCCGEGARRPLVHTITSNQQVMTSSPSSAESLFQAFADVTPIPQDDGPFPVCCIDYEEEFSRAMDYMRAVLRNNEFSERALKLSELCLQHNPANYTLWHYRRKCLAALSNLSNKTPSSSSSSSKSTSIPLLNENQIIHDLKLASSLGGSKPKNYQLFYHRRMLLQSAFSLSSSSSSTETISSGACDDKDLDSSTKSTRDALEWAKEELHYVAQVLKEDDKNYHAWSHRQFILQSMNDSSLWQEEQVYVLSLIAQDCFNNSAWNQKWFVCHRGMHHVPLSSTVAQQEIDYALECAAVDPTNESPWRYLIGLVREQQKAQGHPEKEGDEDDRVTLLLESCLGKIREMQSVLRNSGLDALSFVHMTSAMMDILQLRASAQDLLEAPGLAHSLATNYDIIRCKYWLQREETCRKQVS